MKKFKKFLQLFADGGDGAAAAGGTGSDAANQAQTTAGAENTAEGPSRAEQYKKFKADFKQEYDAEVQGFVKERLKKANAEAQKAKEYHDKTSPVFEALSAMYGIDADDVDGIIEAVRQDDSFYKQAAYDKGMDVAEYRKLRQLENDNKRFAREREMREEEDRQRQFIERINREVELTKTTYPDFDIEKEAADPRFRTLVENGVNVRNAFEVIHQEELQDAIKRQAAQEVASRMQADALQMGSRPSENGISSPNAVKSNLKIANLSDAQMEAINERVRRGERIDFINNF